MQAPRYYTEMRRPIDFISDYGTTPTNITSESSSESSAKGDAAAAIIIEKKPAWGQYLDHVTITPDKPITDILDEIQDLADADGDETVDTGTIELSDEMYATLFFQQLGDLTIPATADTRITITSDGQTLLDNIYAPGLDGSIHLDLRELVHENTAIGLPSHRDAEGDDYQTYYEQEGSGLQMDITTQQGVTTQVFHIWANAFRSEVLDRMSDIDSIDIPADALIPLSVFRDNNLSNAPVRVFLVSATRRVHLHDGAIGDGDGYLITTDVPVSRIPYRPGERFFLEFEIATDRKPGSDPADGLYIWRTVRTPVYRVTPAPAHQYLFLNDYGNYDLVPMSGALTLAPEYETENAFRTYTVERAKATRRPLYTQNSGPLSRQAATVLSSLLLSRRIYYYEPGSAPRLIVIENPSVSISDNNPVNTVTFSWRPAEISNTIQQ